MKNVNKTKRTSPFDNSDKRLCVFESESTKMENTSTFRIASQKFRAVTSKWSYPGTAAIKCHCLCRVKPKVESSMCSYSIESSFRSSLTPLSGYACNVSKSSNFHKFLNINSMQNFQQRNLTFSSLNIKKAANKENVSLKPSTTIDYIDCSDSKIQDLIKDDFLVYEDFVTAEEESSILQEIEPYLNRLKYEQNHWDDVSFFRTSTRLCNRLHFTAVIK